MRITHNGNLVLLNATNEKVWQSFSHLTDALLDGEVLMKGQSLTSQNNSKNMSSGLFYLEISGTSLSAYTKGDRPRRYLFVRPKSSKIEGHNMSYVQFRNANFTFSYGRRRSLQGPSIFPTIQPFSF